MMTLEEKHLNAIRRAPEFRETLMSRLPSPALLTKAVKRMTQDERAELYDACMDAWMNEAPCVFSCEREPEYDSDDGFTYSVCGVRGAYFVQTIECDDLGPFTSKREAIEELRAAYLS